MIGSQYLRWNSLLSNSLLASLLLSSSLIAFSRALPSGEIKQGHEPPLSVRVQGLGPERVVSLNTPFQIQLGDDTHTVTLDLLPTRRLCVPGACFDYPSLFTFEFDGSEGSSTWTLSGNDLTVIVQAMPLATDLDEFAEYFSDALSGVGDGTVIWEDTPALTVDGLRIAGKRMVIPWGEMEFRTNVYGILQGKKRRLAETFIVLQEVRDKGEDTCQEMLDFHEMLVDSLGIEK